MSPFASPTPSRLGETNDAITTAQEPFDDAGPEDFYDEFDGRTVERLYREHAHAAWGVANAILRNPDDASDAVAEAWSRVLRARHRPNAFRAYLLTAVRNAAIDIRRRARHLDQAADVDRWVGFDPAHPRGADEAAVHTDDMRSVAGAFAQLPERWRLALWLIDVEEVSTREAGAVLGVSANNAAQLASRARGRLREEYVQAHVPNHVGPGCGPTVAVLGRYAAGEASRRTKAVVEGHLAGCRDCTARLEALDDLGLRLRRSLPPIPIFLRSRIFGAPARRPRLAGWYDHVASAASTASTSPPVTTAMTQAVANAPFVERVAAGAAATLFAIGVSTLALRSPELSSPPQRPSGAATVEVAAPAPGGGLGGVRGSGSPLGPGGGVGSLAAGAAALAGSAGGPAGGIVPGAGPGGSAAAAGGAGGAAAGSPVDSLAGPVAGTLGSVLPSLPAGASPSLPVSVNGAPLTSAVGGVLAGTDLRNADLRNVDLRGADLHLSNLHDADLHGLDLSRADLRGADLSSANVSGANLTGTNLGGANLTGANLTGANLTGADLRGARTDAADLTGALLGGAITSVPLVSGPPGSGSLGSGSLGSGSLGSGLGGVASASSPVTLPPVTLPGSTGPSASTPEAPGVGSLVAGAAAAAPVGALTSAVGGVLPPASAH